MPPRYLVRINRATALLASALALGGCQPAGSQPAGMPAPEVVVVEVQPKSLEVTHQYVGQAAGSREVEVRARVTGILLSRNFREGEPVKRAQSLFTIDPVPFQLAVTRIEAELAAAQARLDQARRNAARLRPLYEAKAASQKDFDDAVSAENIADADVKVAQARLAEARLNLTYTRVEAPIAGIAGRANRSEGTLVSGPDVLLTAVTQIDPIWIYFGIPERERLALRAEVESGRVVLPQGGFQVKVKLSDGTEYERSGRLSFSDIRVDEATGNVQTRAELPNPRGLLRPGQFMRVVLSGARRPAAIVVPQRAVLEGPQGKFVYVVDADSKVELRPVQVGDWQGADWIVTSGLKPGDKVVVDGLLKIGPGAPVRVAASGAASGTSVKAPPATAAGK